LKSHPLYATWDNMRQRCYNKNNTAYAYYGGRGIDVCSEWKDSFQSFLKDMGSKPTKKHTLDRIDNDKGYSKENCRWATRSEQELNKRRLKKTLCKYKGVKKSFNKFQCQIRFNKKFIYVGLFNSEIEAAMAYDKKYNELHGNDKGCNFKSAKAREALKDTKE
jgi:hypothetical protein